MNIKEAKEQIKNAIKAYFTKDEFGNYIIPIERQRPIFMIGVPGIGKTAIMEQIASELDVGLVSYSMTHHTRQSALGLPFIEKKIYGGKEYNVSEYTMSEIIATVYNTMEASGHKEGILFLDEINCVSETLAPAMLQFLQYKIFGTHKVPEGWIVVTAGNPPEYNNSVREFDVAIWDRLKRVDVEADYSVWKEYAYKSGVHSAITTYLDIKKNNFYSIETTVNGKSFVTARGWSDLSDIIKLYEINNIPVNLQLIDQYIQNKKIARDFSIYYDLYRKYRSDYQIDKIISGTATDEIINRAKEAQFDERLSVIGLIIDSLTKETKEIKLLGDVIKELIKQIQSIQLNLANKPESLDVIFMNQITSINEQISKEKIASSLSSEQEYIYRKTIKYLEEINTKIKKDNIKDTKEILKAIKTFIVSMPKKLQKMTDETRNHITNAFLFLDKAFSNGQEMLIFVTELTVNPFTISFLSSYGCNEYYKHNKDLLFTERQNELEAKIKELDL